MAADRILGFLAGLAFTIVGILVQPSIGAFFTPGDFIGLLFSLFPFFFGLSLIGIAFIRGR